MYPKSHDLPMKRIVTTEHFMGWFGGLRDKRAMRRIQA